MKNYSKITPEGTRDYLFEESDALRAVERHRGTIRAENADPGLRVTIFLPR